MPSIDYAGKELSMFESASNWKKYVARNIKDLVRGDVLDVGAGIGSNLSYLDNASVTSWTLLEPDIKNFSELSKIVIEAKKSLFRINGTLSDVDSSRQYDTIIYYDVLEHISNDKGELNLANKLLKRGGRLIIIVPASMLLYGDFDKSIGHYRRYNKSTLEEVLPNGLIQERRRYLDCVGFALSLMSKFTTNPSEVSNIKFLIWDRIAVRLSGWLDRFTFFSIGKTLVVVARK